MRQGPRRTVPSAALRQCLHARWPRMGQHLSQWFGLTACLIWKIVQKMVNAMARHPFPPWFEQRPVSSHRLSRGGGYGFYTIFSMWTWECVLQGRQGPASPSYSFTSPWGALYPLIHTSVAQSPRTPCPQYFLVCFLLFNSLTDNEEVCSPEFSHELLICQSPVFSLILDFLLSFSFQTHS